MTIIKIFLASSEELKHERLVIAEQVANMNRTLANQDITLRLVKWEYLDSSMGAQHKQEDYNDYLVDCDMCFALFWTRFGMYTEIEFEKSLKELNSKGNIRHLSVLFKESTTKSEELRAFENKCNTEHSTLCHSFEDDDTLKELFNAEIERYISENVRIDNEKDDDNDTKSSIQTVRIFLSIDKTLEQERLELTDLVENLNHSLESRNANILMLAWDNSANDGKDFNEEMSKTDLCLNLYHTSFNNTTQAELESAYQALCEGKNPKKIYVYFKDGDTVPEKLQEFRDSFPTKYGHFYCSFSNIDTLKADFLLQFMEYQSKNLGYNNLLEVKNGKVTLDGKEYVDLQNVPFAGNNEEYNATKKSIEDNKTILSFVPKDDPKYNKAHEELHILQGKLAKMENSLWDTALMITRLSTTKCSERLKRARDLFTAGDNKGAQAVLNEEEIERDVEHNLHLIQLGEEGKKGLATNIDEYKLKIKTLENEMAEGWIHKVIELRTEILRLSKILYGEESLEVIMAYNKLGKIYCLDREYQKALGYYNKSLEVCESNYGDMYPPISHILHEISSIYNDLGRYEEAFKYQYKSIKLDEKLFGVELPISASMYNSIGITFENLGKHEDALKCFQNALNTEIEWKGEIHPNIATSYDNIGCVLVKLGRNEEAIEYQIKALEIRKDVFGERHPDTATSYDNIGCVLGKLGRNEEAIEYQIKALEIRKEVFGDRHPDTATSYNNVALLYEHLYYANAKQGKSDEALNCYLKVYKIRKEILGDNHPDVVQIKENIGHYYMSFGNKYAKNHKYNDSLEYYLKALEILPGNNFLVKIIYRKIGIVYGELGRHEVALEYYFKLLEFEKESGNNLQIGRCYNRLGRTYVAMGDNDNAKKHFLESMNYLTESDEDFADVKQQLNKL